MGIVVHPEDVVVAATPDVVWDVLADLDQWPVWSPRFRLKGSSVSRGSRVTIITSPFPGPPLVLPAVVMRSERGRVLSWGGRVTGLLDLEHSFELEPVADGTRVIHRERFDGIATAPVRLVQDRLRAEYAVMSAGLRAHAEAQTA